MRQVCQISALAAFAMAFAYVSSSGAQAQTLPTDPETQAKVLKGLAIAPVPLNMTGKDPNLVGYGSYIVNSSADCNGCHTADPSVQYAPGGNPYFSQHPAVVNPKTYLGGGSDFGAFPDPAGPFPHIISRNITPDATGMPEGHTYSDFLQIIRTGIDMDHAHPTCTGAPNGKCLPPPFDGTLLQIMPWPTFANMRDLDLQAIYAYLSAIPCLEGGPGELPNRCGTAVAATTTAVAGPKNQSVVTRQYQLDGTQSKAFDGGALTYQWTIPQGYPQAGISGATTATPTVQFGIGRGLYAFQLTVTDSKGKTATDTVGVNFTGN